MLALTSDRFAADEGEANSDREVLPDLVAAGNVEERAAADVLCRREAGRFAVDVRVVVVLNEREGA